MNHHSTMDRNNDCYFYFYSTCTKENNCPFRHCDLALGSEVVCELWRIGRCKDLKCPFRHMEPNINRSMIPCWFESQPMGCRKPHCVFMHTKPRPSITELQDKRSEWILPTGNTLNNSTTYSSSKINAQLGNEVKLLTKENQQINISIDKDEESDDQENNEINTNKYEPAVKTLEQIKMEKILNSSNELLMDSTNNNKAKHGANEIKNNSVRKSQEKFEKKEDSVNFVVKTLEQIRKEREETEQKNQNQENEAILKENKIPNLLKRSNVEENDQKQYTKPIKIRRNRIKTDFTETTANHSNDEIVDTLRFDVDGNEKISEIDLEFLNDLPTNDNSTHFNDTELNIDDDELMREINQVINS